MDEPIEWSEDWRDRSYAVPTAGRLRDGRDRLLLRGGRDGFQGLVRLLREPGATLLVLGAILALVVFFAFAATWTPGAPLRCAAASWGQILAAAARMYVASTLFLGIGLLFIPLAFAITAPAGARRRGLGLRRRTRRASRPARLRLLVFVSGRPSRSSASGSSMAATACASSRSTRPSDRPVRAYRVALAETRPLLGRLGSRSPVGRAHGTVVLIPVAIWLVVRWALLPRWSSSRIAPRGPRCAAAPSSSAAAGSGLRRSSGSARRSPRRRSAPRRAPDLRHRRALALLNVVAGVVYALAMPFVALTTAYMYFDARVRNELEPQETAEELPAEISLAR